MQTGILTASLMDSCVCVLFSHVSLQEQARAAHRHEGDGGGGDRDGGKEAEESPQRRVEGVEEFQIEVSP